MRRISSPTVSGTCCLPLGSKFQIAAIKYSERAKLLAPYRARSHQSVAKASQGHRHAARSILRYVSPPQGPCACGHAAASAAADKCERGHRNDHFATRLAMRACARRPGAPPPVRSVRSPPQPSRALSAALTRHAYQAPATPSLISRPPIHCHMYARDSLPALNCLLTRSRLSRLSTLTPFSLPRSITRRAFHSTPPRRFLDTMIGSFTSRLKKVWSGDGKAPTPVRAWCRKEPLISQVHRKRSRRLRLRSQRRSNHKSLVLHQAQQPPRPLKRAPPTRSIVQTK